MTRTARALLFAATAMSAASTPALSADYGNRSTSSVVVGAPGATVIADRPFTSYHKALGSDRSYAVAPSTTSVTPVGEGTFLVRETRSFGGRVDETVRYVTVPDVTVVVRPDALGRVVYPRR